MNDIGVRIDRVESRLAIQQLPIRYAMAVDGRDINTWESLFVPDVRVGHSFGREALHAHITPLLRTFRRSVHQICGHRIDLDPQDIDRATGAVYCRAEHEVDHRWIVMAICYFDDYRRIDGEWLFARRRERHWYAADISEHPQAVGFDSWHDGVPPSLPDAFPTWDAFWSDEQTPARPG
jgi:SnoaL-like domain